MSGNILILKNQFINKNAPIANGIGRFIPQLMRLTIKFCKSDGSSNGVRQFIDQDIVNFAKENPSVVLYLKPRRHRSPVLVAEFLNGERHCQSINNYSCDEVSAWLDYYKNHSGREYSDQFKYHYTDHQSVQGMWNAHSHADPARASLVFPRVASPKSVEPTATEVLQQIFHSQQEAASLPEAENAALESRKQGEK